MMITQNLLSLFTCSSLLILSLQYFFHTCNANCIPSACGLIPNISTPFHLKNGHINCGDHDPKYELVCENNVASIYQNSQKYYVKAIDYHTLTIRLSLSDVSINDSICSFPISSIFENNFFDTFMSEYQLLTFMSCNNLLHNSSSLVPQLLTDCEQDRHSYILVGNIIFTDVEYMCTINSVVATSWNFTDLKNVSLSEIHQSLLYGFNMSWSRYLCRKCKRGCSYSLLGEWAICNKYRSDLDHRWENIMKSFQPPEGPSAGCLVIFMLFVAVLFAGVTIPAKIIIGFGASFWVLEVPFGVHQKPAYSRDIQRIIAVYFAVRFIIGFLCAMCFLIYKFRRRHLSMYDAIEGFLHSDNKLAPIRYSYSDIKKMTKGFREKLGEGGFGSVYKGKLRSGHHVAVKLLRKSGGKGQDFMNEIATIGRIHHVNIVQLIGYCAQGTKRALIFDFMQNGSLEKYIFNREKTYFLDWEKKFEIAVGVARGIEYLHRGCDIQILHFDIKPHNILLDDKFIPKITDFGLAKSFSIEKDTVTMTAARGTIGYVAPELISRSIGAVSHKADVYSFGMLLMEMVGLNRELKGNNDDSSKYFPCWIYDRFNQGMDIEIEMTGESNGSDENESSIRKSVVRKMTIVGLWCIQMNPDDRPSMNKVLEMMEGDVERLQIPTYPSQSAHVEVNVEESWGTSASDSVSLLHYKNGSNIEITIA